MAFKSDRQRKFVMAKFRVGGRGIGHKSAIIIGEFKSKSDARLSAKRFLKKNRPVVFVTNLKTRKFVVRPTERIR